MIALLAACEAETYDVADLQIDVDAELPAAAETVHVCVDGQGEHDEGAGNGRVAVPALRSDRAAIVTVQVLDEVGGLVFTAETVTLDAESPWASPGEAEGEEICAGGGKFATENQESWLLAVRFREG